MTAARYIFQERRRRFFSLRLDRGLSLRLEVFRRVRSFSPKEKADPLIHCLADRLNETPFRTEWPPGGSNNSSGLFLLHGQRLLEVKYEPRADHEQQCEAQQPRPGGEVPRGMVPMGTGSGRVDQFLVPGKRHALPWIPLQRCMRPRWEHQAFLDRTQYRL